MKIPDILHMDNCRVSGIVLSVCMYVYCYGMSSDESP